MHGNAPHSPFTGVPGWLTDDEESLLMRYASNVGKGGQIVGIGVEYGRSMGAFLKASNAAIFGVELAPKAEYALNIKEGGFSVDRAPILVGDSKQVGKSWHGAIDFLFIDGDHSYEGCLGDIQSWAVHVKPGGFMAFHDVAQLTNKQPHYLHHEVARAIDEWFSSAKAGWSLVETVDTIAVYKRNEVSVKEAETFTVESLDTPITKPPPVEKAKRKPARGRK